MKTRTTVSQTLGLLLSMAIMVPSTVIAGSGSGADFLKIPADAQPTAVGQAYTALANGPAALNWNPAGIGRIGSGQATSALSLSHQQLFFNSHLEQINFISSPDRSSAWGFHLLRLSYEDQDTFDSSGARSGSLSASDMSAGLAMSRRISGMQMGGQFKWIRQELAGETASGPAVDLGLMSPTPFRRLSLGLSVRNLGPKMKFVNEEFSLPLTISAGAGYRMNRAVNIGLDIHSRPHDNETTANLGVEFNAIETFALRAGYVERIAQAIASNQESETNRGSYGDLSGFSGGMGLKLGNMGLDYAFSPFGELGNVHAITISAQFGTTPSAATVSIPMEFSMVETPLLVEEPAVTETVSSVETAPVIDAATYNVDDETLIAPESAAQ